MMLGGLLIDWVTIGTLAFAAVVLIALILAWRALLTSPVAKHG